MKNCRIHGRKPIEISVLHGGPGDFGGTVELAVTLSHKYGVLEPFQTAHTIDGQISELRDLVTAQATIPIVVIGHSWGAWLAVIFAAQYPELVRKVILVSSGPFQQRYVSTLQQRRDERLSDDDRHRIDKLSTALTDPQVENRQDVLRQIGEIFSRVDNADLVTEEFDHAEDIDPAVFAIQPDYFHGLLEEAVTMRVSGELLHKASRIKCPVVAIHGQYDPHPYEGVQEPLQGCISDFTFHLIQDCGHNPWQERQGQEEFYRILWQELE